MKTIPKKGFIAPECLLQHYDAWLAAVKKILELSCSVSLSDPERRRDLLKTNAQCLKYLLHSMQRAVMGDATQVAKTQTDMTELMKSCLVDFAVKRNHLNNAFFSVLFHTPLLFCGVIPALQEAITEGDLSDYKRLEHLELLTILLQNLSSMNLKEHSGIEKYQENIKAVRAWTKDKVDNLQKEENKAYKPEKRRKVLIRFMKLKESM